MSEFINQIVPTIQQWYTAAALWVVTPQFYVQLGLIAAAVFVAYVLAAAAKGAIPVLNNPPGSGRLLWLRSPIYRARVLLFPVLGIFFLGVAVTIAADNVSQSWFVRGARGVAVVFLLFTFISNFISNQFIRLMTKWIGIPLATLQVFGLLSTVTDYLDTVAFSAGDIHISLYALLRTLVFGTVLFWMGRASNSVGQQAIRSQETLHNSTREMLSKLFEIAIFVMVFLLLLQVMGINLTALAVFSGALGVGLGFGLQQIASNFVSGIIILLDRSVTIGDFIELEDGRSGRLRELNTRYGIIETFDGKDVMVPNETFITSSYTNWTHKDPKQRYPLNFQVAYSTDLDLLFENIRKICNDHPTVISGDDLPIELRPDAEIAGFGDSGIDILVEFWINDIDDGKNRVGADLMHSIWRSIQENGMEIPFPQREVRILNGDSLR